MGMRALVVYESMFGNTEKVAHAVATGLAEYGTVDVCGVHDIEPTEVAKVDLLVLGGPTHAFSLSRPTTRSDAIAQGATVGFVDLGLREWMAGLGTGDSRMTTAVFDTRVAKVRHLPGSAARKAAKLAAGHDLRVVGKESFFVLDTPGPLLAGEPDRATAWGRHLGQKLSMPEKPSRARRPESSAESWRPII